MSVRSFLIGGVKEYRHSRALCALGAGLELLLIGLNGCGGLAVGGGSVPIGDGPRTSIQALVVLPESGPVADATVVVRNLSSNKVLQTTTTNASGVFVTEELPFSDIVEVVVSTANGETLKAVAPPIGTLTGVLPTTLDIGVVSVASTLTATSIELEVAAQPANATALVTTQFTLLSQNGIEHVFGGGSNGAGSNGGGTTGPDPLLTDSALLRQVAMDVILQTARTEMMSLSTKPDKTSASIALDGLLGYLNGVHGMTVRLTQAQKTLLIQKQLQGISYTPDRVANALQTAGKPTATGADVLTASKAERVVFSTLVATGTEISPFEALLIAADSGSVGGFHLDQNGLNTFLLTLLSK